MSNHSAESTQVKQLIDEVAYYKHRCETLTECCASIATILGREKDAVLILPLLVKELQHERNLLKIELDTLAIIKEEETLR